MSKYYGSIEDLKSIVKNCGIQGTWKPEKSGNSMKHMFRSERGGVINWWTTGTVMFQGKDPDCSALERALAQYLATKDDNINIEYRPVNNVLINLKDEMLAIEHVSSKR
ncbi:MAG: hypothetical protein PHH91_11600 [Desulfuromonadaceae bacterium]|nr:hypothetical protein [Desulfuromonadaceae bacterium]